MDHKSFFKTLNPKDKARLNARSDAHGLRHLMVYCAVLGGGQVRGFISPCPCGRL
jgi:hypothetical protein